MSNKLFHGEMPPSRTEFEEQFRNDRRYNWWVIEWHLEWIYYVLSNFAVFKLLGILFAILTAGVLIRDILVEQPRERLLQEEARRLTAWQTISSAAGEPGNLGRETALRYLIERNISLSGAPLSNAVLPKFNFVKANLSHADFSGADLQGASFESTKLEGALFNDAELEGTNFKGQNLSGAQFNKSIIQGVSFVNAKLQESSFVFAVVLKADFRQADLNGANLQRINVRGTRHLFGTGEISIDVDFTSANLENTNFEWAALGGATIKDANLKNAKLNLVNNAGDKNQYRNAKGIDFRRSDLEGAEIINSYLRNADFSGANLKGVNFSNTNVSNSKFIGANFEGANLEKTDLRGSSFDSDACLQISFADNWRASYRDPDMECDSKIPSNNI